jgi:signal transduction histidine kinase
VEGSGLGLAIAKWIGDIHDARFSVASTEGVGSAFRVVFPLLTGSSPPSDTPVKAAVVMR